MQGIDQRIQETPHFRIHYTSESFARQHLTQIGERLERAYIVLANLLGVAASGTTSINVYLTELLTDAESGEALAGSGYVITSAREIHEVYSADALGDGLERSLLQVLLGVTFSNEQLLPPLIVDGLLAYVTLSLEGASQSEQVMTELAQAKTEHTLPPLNTLLSGPTPTTQEIYYPAAASFIDFLIRTYDKSRFQEFVSQLQASTVDDAARATLGRTLSQLEKNWRKTLKLAQPGGILWFIKLAGAYLRPYWPQVVEIVFYLACSVAFSIGLARMQGILIDTALIPRDLHALVVIMAIVVGAFILVSLTLLRQSYLTAYVSESVLREIRLRIFTLVQQLHPAFFQMISTGDILSRMTNDLGEIEYAFSEALEQGISMILTLIAAIVTIFIIDWKLALVTLVGTPLFLITGHYFGLATARASLERQKNLAEATSTVQENLGAQAIVKAFGLQERVVADYMRNLNTLFRSSISLTFLSGIFGLSVNSIAYLIQLAVLGVGGWLVIGGNLTVGTLFTFLLLMGEIIGPMQSISGIIQVLQRSSGAMDRVDELLKAESVIADMSGAQKLQRLSHGISFKNVAFSYVDGQLTLHDLNLDIPASANVALVGPSGCGKSTILNLILRFYDPQQGCVTIDDVDLREATLDSVRGQMGIVFQENVLFNISIRENIRLGKLAATEAEVEDAAKAAEIHELIMSMPQGYDTVVGERGSRLSGGQRQRVAIARAILRNPVILLLDEATSALDPRTEAAINATLERIAHGRTTINITHRLSSVVNADRIYVFDRGTLIEQGTHNELLQQGGLYAQLWHEQSGTGGEAQYADVEVSRLRDVPLFAHLDHDLLSTLARRLFIERYAAGDVIITQGEVGDKLYLIARGQVDVLASNPVGKQRSLAVLRSGDHFGEMALMYDMPRSATIRARTPVLLYSLNKDDFNELLVSLSGLREHMKHIINERAQRTAEQEA
ncbi:MAG: ABC transporter transmembrane domain-containing protein [Ktedonobacteraceae bacterium]